MLFNSHLRGFRVFYLQEKVSHCLSLSCPRSLPQTPSKKVIPVRCAWDRNPGVGAGRDAPLKSPLRLSLRASAGHNPPPPGPAPHSTLLEDARAGAGTWQTLEGREMPGRESLGGSPGRWKGPRLSEKKEQKRKVLHRGLERVQSSSG